MIRNRDYILDTRGGQYITREGNGNAVANRIITSIVIARGSFIGDEKFGSQISQITKASNSAELALQRKIENALEYTSSDGSFQALNVAVAVDTVAGTAAVKVTANYDGEVLTVSQNIKI
jgi:hypothetical protein